MRLPLILFAFACTMHLTLAAVTVTPSVVLLGRANTLVIDGVSSGGTLSASEVKLDNMPCNQLTKTGATQYTCVINIPTTVSVRVLQLNVSHLAFLNVSSVPVLSPSSGSQTDDFSVQRSDLWQYDLTNSATNSTACGFESSPAALVFQLYDRSLLTQPYAMLFNTTIRFSGYVIRGGGLGTCEQPDLGDDLVFEVLTGLDGSSTAPQVLRRWDYASSPAAFTSFAFTFTAPASGLFQFRFRQPFYSGPTFDNWAVDDMRFEPAAAAVLKNPVFHETLGGSQLRVRLALEVTGGDVASWATQVVPQAMMRYTKVADGTFTPVTSSVTGLVSGGAHNEVEVQTNTPAMPVGSYTLELSLDNGQSWLQVDRSTPLNISASPQVTGVSVNTSVWDTNDVRIALSGSGFVQGNTYVRIGTRTFVAQVDSFTSAIVRLPGMARGSMRSIDTRVLGPGTRSQAQADAACQQSVGTAFRLATLSVDQQTTELISQLGSLPECRNTSAWIGLRVRAPATNASWYISNATLAYTNFATGVSTPANGDVYVSQSDGKWRFATADAALPDACAACQQVVLDQRVYGVPRVSLDGVGFKVPDTNTSVDVTAPLWVNPGTPLVFAVRDTPVVLAMESTLVTRAFNTSISLQCTNTSIGAVLNASVVDVEHVPRVRDATAADVAASASVYSLTGDGASVTLAPSLSLSSSYVSVAVSGSTSTAPAYDTCVLSVSVQPVTSATASVVRVWPPAMPSTKGGPLTLFGTGLSNDATPATILFNNQVSCANAAYVNGTAVQCADMPAVPLPLGRTPVSLYVNESVVGLRLAAGSPSITVYDLRSVHISAATASAALAGPSTGGTVLHVRAVVHLGASFDLTHLVPVVSLAGHNLPTSVLSYDVNSATLTLAAVSTPSGMPLGSTEVVLSLNGGQSGGVAAQSTFLVYTAPVVDSVEPRVVFSDATGVLTVRGSNLNVYGTASILRWRASDTANQTATTLDKVPFAAGVNGTSLSVTEATSSLNSRIFGAIGGTHGCPAGGTLYDGLCLRVAVSEGNVTSVADATAMCNATAGEVVAAIDGADVNAAIRALIPSSACQEAWIDASASADLGFSAWASGQPLTGTVTLMRRSTGEWESRTLASMSSPPPSAFPMRCVACVDGTRYMPLTYAVSYAPNGVQYSAPERTLQVQRDLTETVNANDFVRGDTESLEGVVDGRVVGTGQGTYVRIAGVTRVAALRVEGHVEMWLATQPSALPAVNGANSVRVQAGANGAIGAQVVRVPHNNMVPWVGLVVPVASANATTTAYRRFKVHVSKPVPDVFLNHTSVGVGASVSRVLVQGTSGAELRLRDEQGRFLAAGGSASSSLVAVAMDDGRECANATVVDAYTVTCTLPSDLPAGVYMPEVEILWANGTLVLFVNGGRNNTLVVHLPVTLRRRGSSDSLDGAPMTGPFTPETFAVAGTYEPWIQSSSLRGTRSNTCGAKVGTYAWKFEGMSRRLRTVLLAADQYTFSFWFRAGGSSSSCERPDTGEVFFVRFRTELGSTLYSTSYGYTSQRAAAFTFATHSYTSSQPGYWEIEQTSFSGSTFDHYAFDDLTLQGTITDPNAGLNAMGSTFPSFVATGGQQELFLLFSQPIVPVASQAVHLEARVGWESDGAPTIPVTLLNPDDPALARTTPFRLPSRSTAGNVNVSLSLDGGVTVAAVARTQVVIRIGSTAWSGFSAYGSKPTLASSQSTHVTGGTSTSTRDNIVLALVASSGYGRLVYVGPYGPLACSSSGNTERCKLPEPLPPGVWDVNVFLQDTQLDVYEITRAGTYANTREAFQVWSHLPMAYEHDLRETVKPYWMDASYSLARYYLSWAASYFQALYASETVWPLSDFVPASQGLQLAFWHTPSYLGTTATAANGVLVEYWVKEGSNGTVTGPFVWPQMQSVRVDNESSTMSQLYDVTCATLMANNHTAADGTPRFLRFRIRPDVALPITVAWSTVTQSNFVANIRLHRGRVATLDLAHAPRNVGGVRTITVATPAVPGRTVSQVQDVIFPGFTSYNVYPGTFLTSDKSAVTGDVTVSLSIRTGASYMDSYTVNMGALTSSVSGDDSPSATLMRAYYGTPNTEPTTTPTPSGKPINVQPGNLTPGEVAGLVSGLGIGVGMFAAVMCIVNGKRGRGPLASMFNNNNNNNNSNNNNRGTGGSGGYVRSVDEPASHNIMVAGGASGSVGGGGGGEAMEMKAISQDAPPQQPQQQQQQQFNLDMYGYGGMDASHFVYQPSGGMQQPIQYGQPGMQYGQPAIQYGQPPMQQYGQPVVGMAPQYSPSSDPAPAYDAPPPPQQNAGKSDAPPAYF